MELTLTNKQFDILFDILRDIVDTLEDDLIDDENIQDYEAYKILQQIKTIQGKV